MGAAFDRGGHSEGDSLEEGSDSSEGGVWVVMLALLAELFMLRLTTWK